MKNNKEFTIGKGMFPLVTASNTEKFSPKVGLQVGHAIQGEWFRRSSGNGCRFYNNSNWFQMLKLHARGEQSIAKYKKLLAFNGDLSYTNLDFSIVPIIPKFVDVISNGLTDLDLSVKAEAQDKVSNTKRSKFIKSLERDMRNKDFLLQAQAQLGVNGFQNDYDKVPDTPEELEVYMSMNYKQSIEVAQEIAIDSIAERNNYDEDVRRRVNYDLVTLGIGAGKHDYDNREGIGIKHVDPESLLYSYTESPSFDDCYYFGEVKREPISTLQKKWNLSDTQVKEIQDNGIEWDNYHKIRVNQTEEFSGHVVNVLYFTYKTSIETDVWKKKIAKDGSENYIKKSPDWNPPLDKLRGSERVSKTDEVWFEGAMILGTDILLEWKMEDYSLRPKSTHNKAISKYVVVAPRIYEGRIESITNRMIPFGDAIQLQHLKLQHVSSRVLPDGVYLDADGLVEIDLGNGKAYNPAEAFNMFMQTGSVIGRSMNTIGEFNHGSVPVKEIVSSSSHNKIASLIEQYNFHLTRLRDVTGINEVVDGSTPDKKMLVGVSEMAMTNSNTATKHIKDASIMFTRNMYKGISYRIADVLQNPTTREQFINEIGKSNVKILDELSTLHLHDFGIYIDVSPDVIEQQKIDQKVNIALTSGQISLDEASVLGDMKNYKMAMRFLGVKIRKRQEEEHLRKEQLIKVQAEENIKLNESNLQTIAAKAKAESDGKISEIRVQGQEDRLTLTHEAELEEDAMKEEFRQQLALQGDKEALALEKDKFKEGEKDKRKTKDNTQQSRLIKQRETGGEPIDFQAEESPEEGFSEGG